MCDKLNKKNINLNVDTISFIEIDCVRNRAVLSCKYNIIDIIKKTYLHEDLSIL